VAGANGAQRTAIGAAYHNGRFRNVKRVNRVELRPDLDQPQASRRCQGPSPNRGHVTMAPVDNRGRRDELTSCGDSDLPGVVSGYTVAREDRDAAGVPGPVVTLTTCWRADVTEGV
jgi:hypothetical protein